MPILVESSFKRISLNDDNITTTMTTKIKICGIMDAEIASHAIQSGANAIGFMCYEKSKRFINLEQAISINQVVTPFISKVIVVANPDSAYLQKIVASIKPDFIQFHGDETADFCRSFGLPYIKAVRVKPDTRLKIIENTYKDASALLLDTYNQGVLGGTGESFDWNLANYDNSIPVILAGGLNPANVCEAIKIAAPYGVDVSSGVESEGVKDAKKITDFCNNIRNNVRNNM